MFLLFKNTLCLIPLVVTLRNSYSFIIAIQSNREQPRWIKLLKQMLKQGYCDNWRHRFWHEDAIDILLRIRLPFFGTRFELFMNDLCFYVILKQKGSADPFCFNTIGLIKAIRKNDIR